MNRRQFIKTSATATVLTSQTPALAGMSSPLPDFRFQSNFWINLHHTLYYQTQVLETVYGLGTAHLAPMEERAYEELSPVGTGIAARPPVRSEHARFAHSAPPSGV